MALLSGCHSSKSRLGPALLKSSLLASSVTSLPRFPPTVHLVDGRRFRRVYLNGTTDGARPYFYFTINPRLARLSLLLTLWLEIPSDRVPALDRDKQYRYPRPGRERECQVRLFHPDLAES